MSSTILTYLLFAVNTGAVIYLVAVVVLQMKGKQKLIEAINIDKKNIIEILEIQKVNNNKLSDADYELLVSVLRKEIEKLDDDKYKTVMKKTLNRKNYYNQKLFALSIFSKSNLAKVVNFG